MVVANRRGLLGGLIAVLIAVSACSAEPGTQGGSADLESDASQTAAEPTAPVATPAVPGMRATAVRLRTDSAIGGQFQTRITNTGSDPFTVLGVSLDSPGFERLPRAGRPAIYQPGATIDLPTQYGPALCGEGVVVDPLFTAVTVQRPNGVMEELRVPLEAPDDIVDRIYHEECHAVRLAAAVDVQLGEFTTGEVDGRTVVQSTIILTRGDNTEDISIFELRGSVVFDVSLAGDGDPPTMPAEEDQLVVPVVLRHTARGCDAHVLGETKQPFLFPYFLTFDSGEPQYGVLDVSQEQKDALWNYVLVACADAGP